MHQHPDDLLLYSLPLSEDSASGLGTRIISLIAGSVVLFIALGARARIAILASLLFIASQVWPVVKGIASGKPLWLKLSPKKLSYKSHLLKTARHIELHHITKVEHSTLCCRLHVQNAEIVEIPAHIFPTGEYEIFLALLEQSVNQAIGARQHEELPEEIKRIEALSHANELKIKEEIQLMDELHQSMAEVYKSVYHVRDEFDKNSKPQAEVIYEFWHPNGSKAYILKDDFIPDLDPESLDVSQHLLEAARQNLELVEARIGYYQQIDRQLRQLRQREQQRSKLSRLAEKLKSLQEKNTLRNDRWQFTPEPNAQEDILTELLLLEELSGKVNQVNNLETAILLKEQMKMLK